MANNGNQFQRYGAVTRRIPWTTGFIFLVIPTSEVDYTDLTYEFPPFNGGRRVFNFLEEAAAACVAGRRDIVICNTSALTNSGLSLLPADTLLMVDGGSCEIGSQFNIQQTTMSANIVQAPSVLSLASHGTVQINSIMLRTDGTGLVGGTNFQLLSSNVDGDPIMFSEAVANLGANQTVITPSVKNLGGIVLAGEGILINSTVADCTGIGTIEMTFRCTRLTDGAFLSFG